jgi:hypothetical protein
VERTEKKMNIDRASQVLPSEFYRCGDQGWIEPGKGKNPGEMQKTDEGISENIYHAFWMDDVLRATEYYDIDVRVRDGRVFLGGHIVSGANHSRIFTALRPIADILEIKDHLILDDRLMLAVAGSLAGLEHEYQCKFFTNVSHGIVSLGGIVISEAVSLLAMKRVASNPNVRGVIDNMRVKGGIPKLSDQTFLQPTIGESIYFADGILGVLKYVVINPDDRRVTAMIVQAETPARRGGKASKDEANLPQQLVIVPVSTIRNLTKVSGFLNISLEERDSLQDYVPDQFFVPDTSWMPPYPYCPDDVLFPISHKQMDHRVENVMHRISLIRNVEGRIPAQELPADYSFGG